MDVCTHSSVARSFWAGPSREAGARLVVLEQYVSWKPNLDLRPPRFRFGRRPPKRAQTAGIRAMRVVEKSIARSGTSGLIRKNGARKPFRIWLYQIPRSRLHIFRSGRRPSHNLALDRHLAISARLICSFPCEARDLFSGCRLACSHVAWQARRLSARVAGSPVNILSALRRQASL